MSALSLYKKNLPEDNKHAGYSINNISFVYSNNWAQGDNFVYQHSCCCSEEPLGRQKDDPIKNSVSFQEGRTAEDMVLDIVLYLDHVLQIRTAKVTEPLHLAMLIFSCHHARKHAASKQRLINLTKKVLNKGNGG